MTDPARQILHVGLAKTGTTTLQRHVFPQVSQLAGYEYNPPELLEGLSRFLLFRDPADRRKIEELRVKHARVFVSDEALATWLPQHFEAAADDLLSLWGPHTTILISLRDPVDFQASLYAGSCRAGAYVRPQDFFLSNEQYGRAAPHEVHWLDDVFNVDQFDLRRLVEIYQERFDRVVVLPLQTQFDLRTLARVFNLSEDQRRAVPKQLASAPRLNSRPAAWDIKAHSLYVKLTGKQTTSPGLGTKLLSHSKTSGAAHSSRGRAWWLRLRAFLYRVLPNTPYQLPSDIYQNAELTQRNREFLAELVADERAADLCPDD
ncbi:hypothetical protein [uncultured Erythrobacter sp.]|uniref:hypothetical protein n=1 Tax=uncultured Erythrobacter sp. TaxID=263913 RepID=UPI0026339503|nr:hypothetical protein [uncultured Erythrobacter sp.]